jgi:N-methylhydantoinase B
MRAVLEYAHDDLAPGDVFCLNDPYDGGTHLPDIVVVRPLFDNSATHLGFALAILHHSDMGGGVPGGHATGATDLFQEGLIIPPVRICRGGVDEAGVWRLILSNTRAPSDVEGDLRSQLAACAGAERQVATLSAALGGAEALHAQMRRIVAYTEQRTRDELVELPDGTWSADDYIDDDGAGNPLRLAVDVTIDSGRVTVDFGRCPEQIPNGLNCNLGTVSSAVYYAFRCLFTTEVPTNGGFARNFDIVARPGSVVSPTRPAPVAARGLTGFRLADLLFRVLAQIRPGLVWAAGEGGLSVVTMGIADRDRQVIFMDTVGGGSGGRPGKDGVEGVAPAIGNVRNNSNEVMERDFPVRIASYGFVSGTGGQGTNRGANAIGREYELLAPKATAFCRSDRRQFTPWGLAGGHPGAPSAVELRRPGRSPEELPATHVFVMHEGDRLWVQTDGGGGFGSPDQRDCARLAQDNREER